MRKKVKGTEIESRVTLHRCEATKIGVTAELDFVLAFYMVHELPDQSVFFAEIEAILNPGGHLLVVEPPFHVSRSGFEETLGRARKARLEIAGRPKVFLSKTALLRKG